MAPSEPSVIYVGMGESTIRNNASFGDGVYRSVNGGLTWTHRGLAATRHISSVRVDPANSDIAYVAALGHAHGPNPERGVYRTSDGGASWELVLHRGEDAGAADLCLDPRNPRILYATMWQGRRLPWTIDSGGPGSGLWRSVDGGDTWEDLSRRPGLPKGVLGRVGVTASGAQAGRVWCVVEAEDGAVFRSDDYGDHWERLSEQEELRQRAWYYSRVIADPRRRGDGVGAERAVLAILGRGQGLLRLPGPARRLPRPVDRPGRHRAHDPGRRRRRQRDAERRPELVHALQPAHRRALPRHDRHPRALPHLRRPAGQHHDRLSQPLLLGGHHPAGH